MANPKEAKARIKINKLLERADWRFFDDENGPANIQLEPHVKITKKDIDSFGEDFEKSEDGFIDFLLMDDKGFPFVVLEAKKEEKNPLDGKEKALPKYIYNILCRVDAKQITPDQDYPSLRLSSIGNIKILLPPLEIQEEIVEQINVKQKAIDHAKEIIKNLERDDILAKRLEG